MIRHFFASSTALLAISTAFPANLLVGDFIAGSSSAAHWLFNASLTLKTSGDRLSFGVECMNCFNETHVQSSLSNYSYYSKPMEWMIRSQDKF